jgi:hypothetical protein
MARMMPTLCRVVAAGILLGALRLAAQMPGTPPGTTVSGDDALNRALKASSLTVDGKPFHAVLEIGKAGEEYSGRVEVWWLKKSVYKLAITSPKFSQQKIVNGGRVWEKDDGDYYPRWLENFVVAILDPVPVIENFRGSGGAVVLGDRITRSCLTRDDRPGGITDQMTWGMVCFADSEPRIQSVLTTNIDFEFKDWREFNGKQIARTVTTNVGGYEEVAGRLTTLDDLGKVDPAMFDVKDVTPPEQRIATSYVSTRTEEAMLERVPVIEWPSVREGKTEGYMIVYARTDRTGQVRETSKHNSDQPGLEDFGMKEALKYKFKPLVVSGVPMQMEMPLVLHFMSRLDDPLPILSVEQMKKQMSGCMTEEVGAGTPIVTVRASVNEQGKLTGESNYREGTAAASMTVLKTLFGCQFAPYIVNGRPTYYHGDVIEGRSR